MAEGHIEGSASGRVEAPVEGEEHTAEVEASRSQGGRRCCSRSRRRRFEEAAAVAGVELQVVVPRQERHCPGFGWEEQVEQAPPVRGRG